MTGRSCIAACLLGVAVSAQQASLPGEAEPLLTDVISAHRAGDLNGAWDAFAAFFEHPARNELHTNAFVACFYGQGCPQPGVLGRILGKRRADLAPLVDGFCPQLRSPEVEAALLEAASLKERSKSIERATSESSGMDSTERVRSGGAGSYVSCGRRRWSPACRTYCR